MSQPKDPSTDRPVIGLTADVVDGRLRLACAYGDMVWRAGGIPVVLACDTGLLGAYLGRCDGFILSGGDDPDTTQWGVPMHPKATPIDPRRQVFETALLSALDDRPTVPALGICLGMQLMGLHAGGRLDQYLPETLSTAGVHWDGPTHPVTGELGRGTVQSHHRQAITDPGSMRVVAAAPDGVIEAIRRDDRSFYLGVQWHAERTADERFGLHLVRRLVACAETAA